MSKFTESASTMHRLSLAAMEEVSRLGQRTADIEHLLLALTLDPEPAGQVLRSHGLTLEATRAAIADQHAEQLAGLGVTTATPPPGRIVFHETDGYAWSDRAQRVFTRASAKGYSGDASTVLTELLAEPSELIDAVVRQAGGDPASISRDLAHAASLPDRRPRRQSRGRLAGTTEAFVPAPIAEVWTLLADPARMHEWESSISSVDTEAPEPGELWSARATTERPDGTPLKIAPGLQRMTIELVEAAPESRIAWRISYPDEPRANPRIIDIGLEPAAGGTQLRIAFTWERGARRPRWQRVLGLFVRPAYRLVIWIQLAQLVSGISRCFR